MKYFNGKNLDEIKTEYRRLALENHPDKGGNTETMQEINAEFEIAYLVYSKKASVQPEETAADFRNNFYTQNGWAGKRYNPNLRLRDIAPIIRGYVKDVYPTWKFSIVQEHYAGGCSLYVSLMEAPENIFIEERIKAFPKRCYSDEDVIILCRQFNAGRGIQNWNHYYDWLSDKAKAVLKDIEILVNSYRFDDSDAMIDYFDTNFYSYFNIGKWNKPLKIVPRTERIQTSYRKAKAKQIAS